MSRPRPLRILFVSSEVTPYSKTGGLADVAGSLTSQLLRSGHDVRVVTPRYRFVTADLTPAEGVGPARLVRDPGKPVWFVDDPLYDTERPYTDDAKEPRRWSLLCRMALAACAAWDWRPDVIHANDWQTGLIPLLVGGPMRSDRHVGGVPTVFSIHNLGYQGRFHAGVLSQLELGGHAALLHQGHLAEGWLSFLETGILHAGQVTTVSPTYAREIQTPEGGAGLHEILATRGVVGILNGIDTAVWNPRTDSRIPYRYSDKSLWRKEWDKRALCEQLGMQYRQHVPVLGFVSRLARQKGIDLMRGPLVHFLETWDVRVAVLGSGQPEYEEFFGALAAMNPGRVAFRSGFDEELAHLIEAGADIFLMPSLYEPCGLNQMYSLAYGTLPVVRRVGGLADTVEPIDQGSGTGFVFEHYTEDGLGWAVGRALDLHTRRQEWRAAQVRAMAEDNSWERSAGDYVDLYRRLAQPPRT